MNLLTLARLAILAGLSSPELTRRIRARHLAARLGRRHHCNAFLPVSHTPSLDPAIRAAVQPD